MALREIISKLEHDATEMISANTRLYLRDLYDHTIQVIDGVETFRDMISGMLDIYLSSVSNRMNEVMKVLTIFASIFIPLTFIAGLYGMNFNTGKSPFNMPELNWYFGYPFALGLWSLRLRRCCCISEGRSGFNAMKGIMKISLIIISLIFFLSSPALSFEGPMQINNLFPILLHADQPIWKEQVWRVPCHTAFHTPALTLCSLRAAGTFSSTWRLPR